MTSTWTTEVVGDFGGFAAGVHFPTGYTEPILMMSTDGVGTKLEIARRSGIWGGVGFDLVAMCVDDLAAAGARPIGFVDYMAVGALQAERDTAIVDSIAEACLQAGCPLLGGETAEHPGVMPPGAVDLAGAVMGVVEASRILDAGRVQEGDIVVGLTSPNLRSNGFSLVRQLLGDEVEEMAAALLEPSVIYSPAVLDAVERAEVHAAAHVTGGGIGANLTRSLPVGLGASIDSASWERPPIFDEIAGRGVSEDEMRRTFNLGIGFCLIVPGHAVGEVQAATAEHDPRVIGEVAEGEGVTID